MLSAYNQRDEDVVAWEVTKEQGPFFCPECRDQVVVKKGQLMAHHFAHLPDASCTYGAGESEQHRQAKYEIYEALRNHCSVSDLKVERSVGEVRPDVSFCWQGKQNVAIELQISDISLNEIRRRTCSYTAKNIWVLWTTPYHRNLSSLTPYRTRLWERYLHALYFGKRYYWLKGEVLVPIHFEPYAVDNPLQERYHEDTQTWHFDPGETFSPVLRNLDFGAQVNITDLRPVTRPAKQLGKFSLPYARLWRLPREETRKS